MRWKPNVSGNQLRLFVRACIAGLILGSANPATAEEQGLKSDAKRAGHAAGSVVRDVGQGARSVGREIGQGVRGAGKAIGGAAKEGGKEFRRAVKGDQR